MLLKWLKLREVADAGVTLADQFPQPPEPLPAARGRQERLRRAHGEALRDFLQRAVHQARGLRLNFLKRVWLANSFKWRLLEKGVDAETANEWTQTLVLEISPKKTNAVPGLAAQADPPGSGKVRNLFTLGQESQGRGAYDEAVAYFQEFLRLKPHRANALNSLGTALYSLGRYEEAQEQFRNAIGREANYPEAHANLGAAYLARGLLREAENSLRRALELKPDNLDPRFNLGLTLLYLGRLDEARGQFEKVLKVEPRRAEALVGMGLVARTQGGFEEAGALFNRALQVNPNVPGAWTALAGLAR